MTPTALIAWRKRLGLSRPAAAKMLGCSTRSMVNWETGVHKIPRYIALACSAISLGIPAHPDGDNEET